MSPTIHVGIFANCLPISVILYVNSQIGVAGGLYTEIIIISVGVQIFTATSSIERSTVMQIGFSLLFTISATPPPEWLQSQRNTDTFDIMFIICKTFFLSLAILFATFGETQICVHV